MKIVICGSMALAGKMCEVSEELKNLGHETVLPMYTEDYVRDGVNELNSGESVENKIKDDLIRQYFGEIAEADAVLIVNEDRKGVENYIGGNVFLEMGFAHVLGKKIYLLNPIPEVSYMDEIIAMQPEVINGYLEEIK